MKTTKNTKQQIKEDNFQKGVLIIVFMITVFRIIGGIILLINASQNSNFCEESLKSNKIHTERFLKNCQNYKLTN